MIDDLGNYVVIMLGPKLFCIYREYFRNSTNHDLKEIIQVGIIPNLIPWWVGFHSSYQPKEWYYMLKSEGKLTFLMLWEEVNI